VSTGARWGSLPSAADSTRASGGLRRGRGDGGAELAAMAARLLLGLQAQLAGEVTEPVQGGIDADVGELGLDYLQVKVPDVAEDTAHPSGRVVPSLAGGEWTSKRKAHWMRGTLLA
jgi:hypothetical protein